MKTKLPYKTFNLYDSYSSDIPFTERLYRWITSVGRYTVIGVEIVVLIAFVGRFFLDQTLNDLTDKVNDNNNVLVRMKSQETRYRDIMKKTDSIKNMNEVFKDKLIDQIPKIYSLAPAGVIIDNIDYSSTQNNSIASEYITISVSAKTDVAPDYEKILTQNILNPDKLSANPNISLKLVNVTSSSISANGYTFTFKLSRVQ